MAWCAGAYVFFCVSILYTIWVKNTQTRAHSQQSSDAVGTVPPQHIIIIIIILGQQYNTPRRNGLEHIPSLKLDLEHLNAFF